MFVDLSQIKIARLLHGRGASYNLLCHLAKHKCAYEEIKASSEGQASLKLEEVSVKFPQPRQSSI